MDKQTLTPVLEQIIERQVAYDSKYKNARDKFYDALHLLLNEDFDKYTFDKKVVTDTLFDSYCDKDLQIALSKLNEKQSNRKETGRFYTPKDVTEYIVSNSFLNIIDKTNAHIYSKLNCLQRLSKEDKKGIDKLLFSHTVFDPSCGAGEFLVTALELKIELYQRNHEKIDDNGLLTILDTINGNDINETSIEISKIRLFFLISSSLENYDNLQCVAQILNKNFEDINFLKIRSANSLFFKKKFNVIVGNPPYVEDRTLSIKPAVKYGNIYANFIENSAKLLDKEGIIGFVLPLSFVSTMRMKRIRNVLDYYCPKQLLSNYADRPDCLFTGVHQKLSILICSNIHSKKEIYTSGYHYWYKKERAALLSDIKLVKNKYAHTNYIPKIANEIEQSIFEKIIAKQEDDTFNSLISNKKDTDSIYLNMRACFWIKAFSFHPGSKEYKPFTYESDIQYYILCLLNSSLFFFYWIAISDCWHITNKELSSFKVLLENINLERFKTLAIDLEKKLEDTKLYIGSKQTEYVYKHKFCKKEIDRIDTALSEVYGLSTEELHYIKNYHFRYRMSEK